MLRPRKKVKFEDYKLRKDIKRGNVSPQLERLKHLREYRGISQDDMAYYLGIHKDTYITKENGMRRFYINELFKIMLILNCDMKDIF